MPSPIQYYILQGTLKGACTAWSPNQNYTSPTPLRGPGAKLTGRWMRHCVEMQQRKG